MHIWEEEATKLQAEPLFFVPEVAKHAQVCIYLILRGCTVNQPVREAHFIADVAFSCPFNVKQFVSKGKCASPYFKFSFFVSVS